MGVVLLKLLLSPSSLISSCFDQTICRIIFWSLGIFNECVYCSARLSPFSSACFINDWLRGKPSSNLPREDRACFNWFLGNLFPYFRNHFNIINYIDRYWRVIGVMHLIFLVIQVIRCRTYETFLNRSKKWEWAGWLSTSNYIHLLSLINCLSHDFKFENVSSHSRTV